LLLGSLKSGLVFRAGVNDAQRVRLDARATAQVMLDAWPGEAFAAPVQELGQVADARTGAFRVELAIKPVKDKPVFAGMVGRAQLPSLAGDVSLYSLPLSAVVDIPKGGVTVFVVQADDSVKRETLALAELRKDAVLVRGPLPADTRYVVSGTSFLSEGEVVKVATTTPATVQGIAK
jgi:multidrug efflux pump subunit AcrA (membrane-fusion protein)